MDFECCSMTGLTGNADGAVTLLDDAENRGQAEASTFTDLFCTEKRLEDMGLGFLVHSDTRIAHGQHYVWTRLYRRVLAGMNFIDLDIRGLDGDLAAPRHGVASIDRQIHQHLFDLAGVGPDSSQTAVEDAYQFHVIADQPAQYRLDLIHGCIQIQEHWQQHLPAAERE